MDEEPLLHGADAAELREHRSGTQRKYMTSLRNIRVVRGQSIELLLPAVDVFVIQHE